MRSIETLRRLFARPDRAEGEPSAAEAELADLEAAPATRTEAVTGDPEELEAQLACERAPDDLAALKHFIRVLERKGKDLPDDIHERALRLELEIKPYELELSRALAALLSRLERPPMPDEVPVDGPLAGRPDDSLDELVRAADAYAQADETFKAYAALWQACVRYPADARGWAEYARFFADRHEWRNCRLAIQRTFARWTNTVAPAAHALIAALRALAENGRLDEIDWKAWFDALPEDLRANSDALRLLVAVGDPRGPALAPRLLQGGARSVDICLAAAIAAFEKEQSADAYAHLKRAFELDAAAALHALIRDWNAPFTEVIEDVGKEDEFADWLADRHAQWPGINLVPGQPAPEALSKAQRQRQRALDQGLPPFLFAALFKSGSATMNHIVAAGFDLPAVLYSVSLLRVVRPWLGDFLRGGAGYTTHLFPVARNIESLSAAGAKVIVHVRDPRQVLVSNVGHSRLYPRELRPSDRRQYAVGPREQVEVAINDGFSRAVAWIDGWVKSRGRLDVHFTTFEDFISDREAFIDRLLALYGGDTRYFNRDIALGRAASVDFHRRSGEVDEWRRLLDAEQTRRVNARIPDEFWSLFGWSP